MLPSALAACCSPSATVARPFWMSSTRLGPPWSWEEPEKPSHESQDWPSPSSTSASPCRNRQGSKGYSKACQGGGLASRSRLTTPCRTH